MSTTTNSTPGAADSCEPDAQTADSHQATLMNGTSETCSQPTLPGIDIAIGSPASVDSRSASSGLAGPTTGQSGRVGFPVRTSARPAKARDSTELEAACGGDGLTLFEPADPTGLSLRMSLLLDCEALTGCSLSWNKRATPAGRSWWVLGRSGLATGGIGSGSWPTVHGNLGNNGPTGTEPGRAVTRTWPTPRAAETGNYQYDRGDHSKPRPTLTGMAKNWPSPKSRDWKGMGPADHNRKSPCLNAAAAGQPDQANRSTNGKPRDFPTPTANRRIGLQSHGRNVVKGNLNPDWVSQLMGYPDGWLDVNESDDCRPSATP